MANLFLLCSSGAARLKERAMADISDLGGDSDKKKPFPPIEKLAVERLADATKSPLDDLDLRMKTIKAALGDGTPNLLARAERQLRGGSLVDKHIEAAQKSITDALGGTFDDYYKSRDHMRDVFGSKALTDEVSRMINGPSAGMEADKYLAGLERSHHHDSVLHDHPPLHIQPNPIHETNEHLAGVGQKIDALVDLQAKQAEVFDKLLLVQVENVAEQDRATRRSYRLGVVNAVLATILGVGAIVATVIIAG